MATNVRFFVRFYHNLGLYFQTINRTNIFPINRLMPNSINRLINRLMASLDVWYVFVPGVNTKKARTFTVYIVSKIHNWCMTLCIIKERMSRMVEVLFFLIIVCHNSSLASMSSQDRMFLHVLLWCILTWDEIGRMEDKDLMLPSFFPPTTI